MCAKTLEMNVVATGTQLSFLCRLCGEVMPREDGFRILGRHTFHDECYELAVQRLSEFFIDLICVSDDEWEKWVEENQDG
jgi:hypothetical protein